MLVASAKRGVLGGFAREELVDDESVESDRFGARCRAEGRFLSSLIAIAAECCV